MTERRDNNGDDLIVDVLGIRSNDRVLQVGGKKMSSIDKYVVEEVRYVDDFDDLKALSHLDFDRIIAIAPDTRNVGRLVDMNVGTVSMLFFDDRSMTKVEDMLMDRWPYANVWRMKLDTLGLLITDANGGR